MTTELETDAIQEAVARLRLITDRLRLFAMICIFILIGQILILLIFIAQEMVLEIALPRRAASLTSALMFVCCFVAVVGFDRAKRTGDALFDEISDEFQWNIRSRRISLIEGSHSSPSYESSYEVRPPINVRFALRAYVNNSDMPLFPGRYGPLMCGILSGALFVFTIFMTRAFLSF